jgi:hypothetical protein
MGGYYRSFFLKSADCSAEVAIEQDRASMVKGIRKDIMIIDRREMDS